MRTILGLNSPISFGIFHPHLLAPLALLAATLGWTQLLPAQTPPTAAQLAQAHKKSHKHQRPAAAKKTGEQIQVVSVGVEQPAPEVPLWPANEAAVHATVTWDSRGLYIDAANSSLQQILKEVATVTGATVEGLDADQRIFGAYGPGKARDVLSLLLQGTTYNVLMIGDQGEGTPRQIVLSARHTAGSTAVASNPSPTASSDDDVDTDDQSQQQPPQPPIRPGFPPGQRTPQQMHPQPGQPGQPQPNNPQ